MNSNCRLSIIVPVYNVEQWLVRCLDSLYNQELDEDEFEVIIVNDGSPDKSLQLADAYALKHRNMLVITRENGGLSAARNTGLDHARGKYVWFVDSDDRIEPNSIDELLLFAENWHLDVLCFNLKKEYVDGRIEDYTISDCLDSAICKGEEFICKVGMPPAAWAAYYRRDYLSKHKLRFYEGILHEDMEFTPRAYCLASQIAFLDRPIYYYMQRPGSIMHSSSALKRCGDFIKIADSLYSFAYLHLSQKSKAYDKFVNLVFFSISQSLAYYSKRFFPISIYLSKPYIPFKIKSLTLGNLWKGVLMNISIRLYLSLYRLKKLC